MVDAVVDAAVDAVVDATGDATGDGVGGSIAFGGGTGWGDIFEFNFTMGWERNIFIYFFY